MSARSIERSIQKHKERRWRNVEAPLKEMVEATAVRIRDHVVPTIMVMKRAFELGDIPNVGKGIDLLLDCFQEYVYEEPPKQDQGGSGEETSNSTASEARDDGQPSEVPHSGGAETR